jgi:hypothetical protein
MESVVFERTKKKAKNMDEETEIDLFEQNEEIISEAREKVLAKLDVLEKKLWPKTYKELTAVIEKYCQVYASCPIRV